MASKEWYSLGVFRTVLWWEGERLGCLERTEQQGWVWKAKRGVRLTEQQMEEVVSEMVARKPRGWFWVEEDGVARLVQPREGV